jgi:hypothetical protein
MTFTLTHTCPGCYNNSKNSLKTAVAMVEHKNDYLYAAWISYKNSLPLCWGMCGLLQVHWKAPHSCQCLMFWLHLTLATVPTIHMNFLHEQQTRTISRVSARLPANKLNEMIFIKNLFLKKLHEKYHNDSVVSKAYCEIFNFPVTLGDKLHACKWILLAPHDSEQNKFLIVHMQIFTLWLQDNFPQLI